MAPATASGDANSLTPDAGRFANSANIPPFTHAIITASADIERVQDADIASSHGSNASADIVDKSIVPTVVQNAGECIAEYFKKWRGHAGQSSPPMVHWTEFLWSFIGSFLGMSAVAMLNYYCPEVSGTQMVMMIGSFGATAVLAYSVPSAPLSQPRSIIGGHVISATIGLAVRTLMIDMLPSEHVLSRDLSWVPAALSVALAINAMQLSKTLHPPGGATALIAVTADGALKDLGWWFVLTPVAAGACIMLLIALLVNNMASRRQYPVYWL